jgi:hypothetical protein
MASVSADLALSANEDAEFRLQKARLFKATIAVNVLYGVVALGILLAIFFSDGARDLFITRLAPFTITFLVGMLLVIIWLIIIVRTFKPQKSATITYDPYNCPDYFELERTPEDVLSKFDESIRADMTYRCKPREGVFGSSLHTSAAMTTPIIPITGEWVVGAKPAKPLYEKVIKPVNTTTGISVDDKMSCTTIYPGLLNRRDVIDNKEQQNKYRCQYIATSGCKNLNWSSVCPYPPK